MSSQGADQPAPKRRAPRWIIGVVALVVVAALVLVAVRVWGAPAASPQPGHSGPSQSGTTTVPSAPGSPTSSASRKPGHRPSASASASPRVVKRPIPSPSVPPATASGKPTVVPTHATKTTSVPLHRTGRLGNGVKVSVSKIDKVHGVAQGPGEIAGPALRVTIKIANGTRRPVSMDLAIVNMYYGKAQTPASGLSGPGVVPLAAEIPPGRSGSGSYVFGVPTNDRKTVTVEFSYTTEAPTVIFTGAP